MFPIALLPPHIILPDAGHYGACAGNNDFPCVDYNLFFHTFMAKSAIADETRSGARAVSQGRRLNIKLRGRKQQKSGGLWHIPT